jgi:hypothetical protein
MIIGGNKASKLPLPESAPSEGGAIANANSSIMITFI